MRNQLPVIIFLFTLSLISCQDDILDFERIINFEIQGVRIPEEGNVSDTMVFRFSSPSNLRALILPSKGDGNFYVNGTPVITNGRSPVELGDGNRLSYVANRVGIHSGQMILFNSSDQRDTVDYQMSVSKRLPDYNARLYRDEDSGDFVLYLKQQGPEELDAVYDIRVMGNNSIELILNFAGRGQDYRLGDRIRLNYRDIVENGYTMPIKMELVSAEQQRSRVNFEVTDENNKQVSISKSLFFSTDGPTRPAEAEPVILPDFNMRVFSSDTSTFNMYIKQQTSNEKGDVNYRMYVEGASGDNDIELEIYFAGREYLYRLGDIIHAEYSEFQNNNYVLAFNINLVEGPRESYRLNFIVEDEFGKKVTVTKEFKINPAI
jgi:hypothetical protein